MVTAKTAWSSAALEFSGRLRVPPWRISGRTRRPKSCWKINRDLNSQENPDSHVRALSIVMEMHYFFARTHVVVVLLYS
jgi:hypothetical protein